MQGQLDLAGDKRARRRRRGDVFGEDVSLAVAVAILGGLGNGWCAVLARRYRGGMHLSRGGIRSFRDGKLRLVLVLLAVRGHVKS